jgi:hypothetical protein
MTMIESPSYDDLLTFARVMYEIEWQYSSEPGEPILSYFEKPHKWDAEYQKWKELGGSLEKECMDAFEKWLDSKDFGDDDE